MTTSRRPTWVVTALLLWCGAVSCGKTELGELFASAGDGGMSASSEPGGESSANAAAGGVRSPAEGGCGSTSCSGEPGAGTSGDAGPEPCDQACLDSVVDQASDFGMPWRSSWFLVGCMDKQGHDCVNVEPCPNQDAESFEAQGTTTTETFPIGGIPGRHYKATFTFNAIVSAKEYQGGIRDQTNEVFSDLLEYGSDDPSPFDTFHRDGSPIASNYDSWKLTVFDDAGQEARHYFLNSFPTGMGFESHRVFRPSYSKSIVVVGGGKVTHQVHDPNCHPIDNCDWWIDECYPLDLPMEPKDVALPLVYVDPADAQLKPIAQLNELAWPLDHPAQPWHSQLGHLTITNVEETDDPVTHDYL